MKKLLHFTADWCGPCQKMKPVIDQLLQEDKDIEYLKFDIDDPKNSSKIHEYKVMSVPTFISILEDGSSFMHNGAAPIEKLKSILFSK